MRSRGRSSLTIQCYHKCANVPDLLPLASFVQHWAADFIRAAALYLLVALAMTAARRWLGPALIQMTLGRRDLLGISAGALLGVVTPVCSCSVAPVYLSLLAGGASRQAAAAYLFAAPAVNEIALALVLAAWGTKGMLLYLAAGFSAALLTGLLAERLGLGPRVQSVAAATAGLPAELADAVRRLKSFAGPLALGTAIGALFHLFPPRQWDWLEAAAAHPMGPLGAALIGLPLDIGAAAAAPVFLPLAAQGWPAGTLISLLMALTVASTPEGVVLSRVLGWRRVSMYALWLASYIALVGFIFNLWPVLAL
jgi:uncharacterized protein